MPTGEGKVTEFPDFAMQCARAFGACITMLDDPADAPIPDEFTPPDYHEKQLAIARARLAEVEAMSPEQIEAAALADYENAKARHDKYEAEQELAEQRLEQMLEKVKAWTPPTGEHVGLKTFMLEQIKLSRRGSHRSEEPTRLEPAEWLRTQVEQLRSDIGYHASEQAKEIELARGRTAWVRALRASLVSEHPNTRPR